MKLEEAQNIINQIANKKFGTLIPENQFSDVIVNKGKAGQMLEKIILHLHLSSSLRDFDDGELKTNKCDANGKPLETMAITQISSNIDNLIQANPFNQSALAIKISNFLYVPIVREGDPHNWFFMNPIHVDFSQEQYSDLWKQLEKDYYIICEKIKNDIEQHGTISTSNGTYLQIRTKDSKPYHPIFSQIYNRFISNKNYAFYFQKSFMQALQEYQHNLNNKIS
jgi:DNA mismatch repair protein MutH